MEGILLPLLIGLIGASIGASASIITVIVQSHYQNRRELSRLSAQIALEEYKIHWDAVKDTGGKLFPLLGFLYYNRELLKLAEKNELTVDRLKELTETLDKFSDFIHEADRKRRKGGVS